ncbi:MAG: biopolymer transporter ExbD [Campylobacterales bacterium]|nr:biopolymer transporter ExbD [Campylobacterales bacterium]
MRSIKRYDGINVVPFIDVLLVLLAIVFVISNFIALGKLDVSLASSSTKEKIKELKREIVITKERKFFIDKKELEKEEFIAQLKEFKSSDDITILSDKGSLYEDFIFVVDKLKENNLEKISMAVTQ